jgi:hypothetical protein
MGCGIILEAVMFSQLKNMRPSNTQPGRNYFTTTGTTEHEGFKFLFLWSFMASVVNNFGTNNENVI